MSALLEYHLPQLGKISARLYECADKTYQLLDHYKHIERMRRMDQLGVIRNVYGGAHHSRWEYVMLQLCLVHKLSVAVDEQGAKLAKGLGLGTRSLDFQGYKPTGADLLQTWALLFNAGHLPGTFATERAILRCCATNDQLKRIIKLGLPANKRDYFENVIKAEDIYSVHKVLISFHLERYRRHALARNGFIDFLQEIISFYMSRRDDHKDKRANLKTLFHRVRQVSYLFLDSQYGPNPVDFDLATVFLNFSEYVPVLFRQLDSPILRVLDSYEDLLSTSMYHSGPSIRELGAHARGVANAIKRRQAQAELHKITGLHRYLKNERNQHDDFIPKRTEWRNALNLHVLLEPPTLLKETLIDILRKYTTCNEEEECNRRCGTTRCQLTFQVAPSSGQLAITLSFFPDGRLPGEVRALAAFLRHILSLNEKAKGDERAARYRLQDLVDYTFQRPYRDLIISVLAFLAQPGLRFEFADDSATGRFPFFGIRGSRKAAGKLDRTCKRMGQSNSRLHELQTLQRSLLNIGHQSHLLVSQLRLLVHDEQRRHVTDIDGLALSLKGSCLRVLLVEAKDQRQGAAAASKAHLNRTLKKLAFKTSVTPLISPVQGGAYCHLPLDGL